MTQTNGELKVLIELADALRSRGIRVFHGSYDGRDVLMEFGPSEKTDELIKDSSPAIDPDVCRCGHAGYQHQSGLCIMGCDPEKCIDPDKPS